MDSNLNISPDISDKGAIKEIYQRTGRVTPSASPTYKTAICVPVIVIGSGSRYLRSVH